MLSVVYELMSKYQVDSVYIDGANPSFIRSLKLQIGEDPDYDKVIARYKSEGLGDSWTQNMRIVPVNFNKEHKANIVQNYHSRITLIWPLQLCMSLLVKNYR
jgi:hypothetical protein